MILIPALLLWQGANGQYCGGGPFSAADSNVESVNITGDNATSIIYTGCPGVTFLEDQTIETVDLTAGSIYSISVQFGSCAGNYAGAGEVWIDFNQNQTYEASESIGSSSGTPGTSPWDAALTFNFIVPTFSVAGNTRIRVKQQEGEDLPLDPCGFFQWGSVVDFTANITVPPITCQFPSNLVSSFVSSIGATIDWTENGTATSWNIEWGALGFIPGAGNEIGSDLGNTSQTLIITSLSSNTNYDVYVQADCGPGNQSFWLGPLTFTTPCNVFLAPFYEDFNSGLQPNCWGNLSSALNGNPNAFWEFDGTPAYGASNNGRPDGTFAYSDGSQPFPDSVMLISPSIDISPLTSPELTFEWFSNNTNTPGDNTPFIIEVFDGTSWNYLDTLIGDNTAWQNAFYDLSAYAGTTIQVRFMTNKTISSGSFYNDILVDEVKVDELTTCLPPTNLVALNITSNAADLSWTEINSSTSWNIEIGISGFVQGSGTGTSISAVGSNPYTVAVLPFTDYEFYVQSICGPNDQSTWSGPFAFTTLCDNVVAPWSEDFSNGGNIPDCWSNGPFSTENWNFDNTTAQNSHIGNAGVLNGTTTSGNYFAWVDDSAPHSIQTTLLSPMIDVSNLIIPTLYFYYISDNEGFTNVDFSVDVWDGVNWNIGIFMSNTNTVGGWTEVTLPLNALNITGDIQLRFGNNEMNGTDFYDDIAIDDVRIDEAPLCIPPSALTASNITATQADFAWTENGISTTWNIEWGGSGFTQGTGALESGVTNPYTLTGLAVNTPYDYYVQTDCGINQSAWVGPFTFTTPCVLVTGTDTQVACENFIWIDGIDYTISNNTAVYTLAGAAVNGCDSIVTLDLTINNVTTGFDTQSACEAFTWIDGVNYTSDNNTATFTLVGGAVTGCDSILILNLSIDVTNDAGSDSIVKACENQPVDLDTLLSTSAAAGGRWLDPINSTLAGSFVMLYYQPGNYDFSYVVQMGSCPSDTAVISIEVVSGCDFLSISDEIMVDISVYPNPASSVLTILNPSNVSALKVEMLDMNGRVVLVEDKILNNAMKATLAIDQIETGFYTLRVYNSEGQKTFKIVKQ